jgi:hypothetical protein
MVVAYGGWIFFRILAGNTISWMWIPMIGQEWDAIASYSWASTTLAWLYRQMCDACRRCGPNANLGGCAYLLQLWMWERLPIGGQSATHLVYVICISNILKHLSFEFLIRFGTMLQDLPYDGEVPLATVGYLWTNIARVHGNPRRRYIDYTNGLDCLQPIHVSDTIHHYYFLS